MRIIWALEARLDLRDIYTYIAADNPRAARKLEKRIGNDVSLLSRMPGIGRQGRVEDTRELVISKTPYIVPYRIKGKIVEIIRVYHSARLWPENFDA